MTAFPYPQPEQLLPHRAPMLFLDRVLAADEESILCQGTIGAGHPLLYQGKLPPAALLEYLAQAAAAHRALLAQAERGGSPSAIPGSLALIRDAVFSGEAPALGQRLEICASLSARHPPFFTYQGTVSCRSGELCRAGFTVATAAGGG